MGLQPRKILDDAVVDNGEAAIAAGLRMGVDLIGLTVGGPAGMAHAHRAGKGRAVRRQLRQSRQAARRFIDLQALRAAHRHAGGVVAPVLQTAQAVQQDGGGLLAAHVAYYSTHIQFLLIKIEEEQTRRPFVFASGHSLFVLRSPAYLLAVYAPGQHGRTSAESFR